MAEGELNEVLIILTEQSDVQKAHDVADARVFKTEPLLQGHLRRPRKFRTQLFIGIDLQRPQSSADVALGDGGEPEALAEAAAQIRRLG